MEIKQYDSDLIERNKAVSGCFWMLVLFLAITAVPVFFQDSPQLLARGYLAPVIFTAEFLIIVPVYYLFFRRRAGLGLGGFRPDIFLILLFIILLVQYIFPYLMGKRSAEGWSTGQFTLAPPVFWLNSLLLVFVVPIYEEMVFRGCLFNVFKVWLRDNIYAAAVAVSVIFSAVHLQYTDIRTFIVLFLVSLVLIAARVKMGGILMPVILHMAMNAIVIAVQYAAYLLGAFAG